MASNEPDGTAPARRDRLGALMLRHRFWTAVALAAAFYLLTAVSTLLVGAVWDGFAESGSVTWLVLVPMSIFYGLAMAGWFARSPVGRSRVEAEHLGRLRTAGRAARRGRPVRLDQELGELFARQADHEATELRRLRPVVPVLVGLVVALAGVVAASLTVWPLAVLLWIVAAPAGGLVWWAVQRHIRLAESLAEAGPR